VTCDDPHHCVTCADEAVPLVVTEIVDASTARCDAVEVMVDLVGPVDVGDVLLVHAGVALARGAA